MELVDLILVKGKFKLLAPYHSEVWNRLLVNSDWNLKLHELAEISGVLHFLQDDAFLHLSDVFLHHDLV